MNKQDPNSWKKLQQKSVSRRNLIRGAAGAALGAGLLRPGPAFAGQEDDDRGCRGPRLNPIPGGGGPFAPFGVKVHHNPLNPATPLASISDPSQVTDFDGLVFSTSIAAAGKENSTAVEYFFPITAMKCYAQYDCSGQQLLDAGEVPHARQVRN